MVLRATPQQAALAAALRDKLNMSPSYASELARGARQPSMKMALRIYREIGVKLGLLAHATKAEINVLERVSAREDASAAVRQDEAAA